MRLLFDIGNTLTKIGIKKDGTLKKYRIATNTELTEDELYLKIKPFIEGMDVLEIGISSVVPEMTMLLKSMIEKYFELTPIIVGPGVKTGLRVIAEYPGEVGADLVCDAVGSFKYGKTVLVIDLGTAIKYLMVDNQTLTGVVIAPGIETSVTALIENTALLPDFEIKIPPRVLGNNTIHCLQSGITYGIAAQIEGMVKRIEKEIGKTFKIVLSGGFSKLMSEVLDLDVHVNKMLVLEGLDDIMNKNI